MTAPTTHPSNEALAVQQETDEQRRSQDGERP